MNRAQVEALLFRMNAVLPPRRALDPLVERARAVEWADSPLEAVPNEHALEAFDRWKAGADEQPTLRQFIGACRQVTAERTPALPEPAPVADPAVLDGIRACRRSLPADDGPRVPVPGLGLVHESTARRLGLRRDR